LYNIKNNPALIEWAWIRESIIISTLTCLWLFTIMFINVANKEEGQGRATIFVFIVLIVPINLLLCHPGYERLGLDSDQWYSYYPYFGLSLMAIHGIGFWVLQKWTKQYLDERSFVKK
jgi:hypothetical protein